MPDVEPAGAAVPIVLVTPPMAIGSGYYRPLSVPAESVGIDT